MSIELIIVIIVVLLAVGNIAWRKVQVIGLALTLLCFAGGLFIPLSQFSPGLLTFAKFTPVYGLNELVPYRWPAAPCNGAGP